MLFGGCDDMVGGLFLATCSHLVHPFPSTFSDVVQCFAMYVMAQMP